MVFCKLPVEILEFGKINNEMGRGVEVVDVEYVTDGSVDHLARLVGQNGKAFFQISQPSSCNPYPSPENDRHLHLPELYLKLDIWNLISDVNIFTFKAFYNLHSDLAFKM